MFWIILEEVLWAKCSAERRYIKGRNDESEYSLKRDETLSVEDCSFVILSNYKACVQSFILELNNVLSWIFI